MARSWKSRPKEVFFDFLSFASPEARVFNLSSILLILGVMPTDSLGYSPVKCVFKHFLLPLIFNGACPSDGLFADCNCPACGMTRGMSRLLHGDLEGAMSMNRFVIVLLVAMIAVIIGGIITIVRGKGRYIVRKV
jgi:hypothetical protein